MKASDEDDPWLGAFKSKAHEEQQRKLDLTTSTDEETVERRRISGYIKAHWNGEHSLEQSYWVNGVLVMLVLRLAAALIERGARDLTAETQVLTGFLYLAMSGAISVWVLVGIWRSAINSLAKKLGSFWPRVAQIMVIVGVLGTGYNLLTNGVDLTNMLAALRDPSLQEYWVERRGDTIVVFTGAINRKSADEVIGLVDDPSIEMLVVNSHGGLAADAIYLARFIRERGITVVGDGQCVSGCILLLAASPRTAIVPGTEVSLHRGEPLADFTNPESRRAAYQEAADFNRLLREFGIEDWAIEKARQQAYWTPTIPQLIDMGMISEIYDVTNQRLVEANEYCADHPLSCPETVGLATEKSPAMSSTHQKLLNEFMEAVERGDLETAKRHAETAALEAEKNYGPGDARFGEALFLLTQAHLISGDYARAEETGIRMVQLLERTYGPDHVETAAALAILAKVYGGQMKFDKAEPLLRRAVKIKRKGFGPDVPETAVTESTLGEVLANMGKFPEAEELLTHSLKVFETSWPVSNERIPIGFRLNIATSSETLGYVYQRQGRLDDAEALIEKALKVRKVLVGDEHPSMFSTLLSLGNLYAASRRHEESEKAFRQALEIAEHSFGPQHPNVALAAGALAEACQVQGRDDEAEKLLRKCLTIDDAALAPDHPQLLQHLDAYSNLLRKMGRDREAREFEARANAIRGE